MTNNYLTVLITKLSINLEIKIFPVSMYSTELNNNEIFR